MSARTITGYADLRRAEKECAPEDVVETNVGFLCALRRNSDDRDGLAKAALQGMLARPNSSPPGGHSKTIDGYAAAAYEFAEAMLKARQA